MSNKTHTHNPRTGTRTRTEGQQKIDNVEADLKTKLDKATVRKHSKERSVGFITYELENMRGKHNLESVSKKMIVIKGIDILGACFHQNKFF